MILYRVGWNVPDHGGKVSPWVPWDGPETSKAEVDRVLTSGGVSCKGLARALNMSGFGWWTETKEEHE